MNFSPNYTDIGIKINKKIYTGKSKKNMYNLAEKAEKHERKNW